jgi:hypothetical protein
MCFVNFAKDILHQVFIYTYKKSYINFYIKETADIHIPKCKFISNRPRPPKQHSKKE